MSNRIEILSPRLANQIAAGEVVERPSSVIKELLENALDAGASRIEIEAERGGVQLLRVTDDGHGIHPDDLALALARHATSKIKTLDDLTAVISLGFRGEALASIASVSKLTLISKQKEQETAWLAFAEGAGMKVETRPAALDKGTRLEVRDLFFNTPARRRFLRSENTEFAHVDETVKRVALARPDVAFKLTHNGKTVRQFRAGKDLEALKERVGAVLGRSFLVSAFYTDQHLDDYRLHGWVGHPEQHRAQADGQYVFVNGRAIRDRVVSHAIRAAYEAQIPKGRAPCFALFLEMPAHEVDVNVHPTKHEVRFRQSRWVHDWITQVVRESLSLLEHKRVEQAHESTPAWSSLSPAKRAVPVATLTKQEIRDSLAFYATQNPSQHNSQTTSQNDDQRLINVGEALWFSAQFGPSLWHTKNLLRTFLQHQWLIKNPERQALLMPISCSFNAVEYARLAELSFVFKDGLLMQAPLALKGADWQVLLPQLVNTEAALDVACTHLYALFAHNETYWARLITWSQSLEDKRGIQRVLTKEDWQILWQNEAQGMGES